MSTGSEPCSGVSYVSVATFLRIFSKRLNVLSKQCVLSAERPVVTGRAGGCGCSGQRAESMPDCGAEWETALLMQGLECCRCRGSGMTRPSLFKMR